MVAAGQRQIILVKAVVARVLRDREKQRIMKMLWEVMDSICQTG